MYRLNFKNVILGTIMASVMIITGCSAGSNETTDTTIDAESMSLPVHPPVPPSTITPSNEQLESEKATRELDDLVKSIGGPRDQMITVMKKFCDTWLNWGRELTGPPSYRMHEPSENLYYARFARKAGEYYDAAALDDWRRGTTNAGVLPPLFSQVWPGRCGR